MSTTTRPTVYAPRTASCRPTMRFAVQPILDLRTGRIPAVELLARPSSGGSVADWSTEELALASRGLARDALDVARELPIDGGLIHVNITAIDLEDETFSTEVLRRFPDRIDHLVLELTEHFELRDRPTVAANLHRLRTAGVRFALDDFGDGWSTMSALRALRPEILKVNLGSLRGTHGIDRNVATWVRNRAHVARCRRVVVEHLDSLEAVEEALGAGFRYGQGFVLDRYLAKQAGAPVGTTAVIEIDAPIDLRAA